MRLTNLHRRAFVRAAMQDVPFIDYLEQARTLANKKVLAMHKKIGLDKIDPDRLYERTIRCAPSPIEWPTGLNFSVRGLMVHERAELENDPEICALVLKNHEQHVNKRILEDRLSQAIAACSTHKQASEAMPEFVKYLPIENGKSSRSVPTTTQLVDDFIKAGWPKSRQPIVNASVVEDKETV